ncbi:MAG: zinc-dependent metalloprotease [Chloroflexi bacterium]|nr:zinc-dependent metalloprotease [Chloroflexota bacterium]
MPTDSQRDLRRFGAALLLAIVAGASVRYVTARAAASTSRPRVIDWRQARMIGLAVSQSHLAPVPDRAARQEQYLRLVQRSEPLIATYMGVQLPQPINRVYVFDRAEWIEANLTSFQALFAPLEELYADVSARQGALALAFGRLNSQIIGAQMGALIGFLARRVLGQYDLGLLSPDPELRGALYFVEPNIARVRAQLGLHDEDFRMWIALHETTHVFEFEAFPWVRDYFQDLLRQFLGQVTDQFSALGVGIARLIERLIQGLPPDQHWIELMLTPEQQRIFARMQALMSLVEGYSNHIMNAIGGQLLPSYQQIEDRVRQRQLRRPLIEEAFNRVTGMDLKLAQYQQGEAFINAIVAMRGPAFANRVWERAEHLPTMEEIRAPQRWITRMEA